MLSSSKAVAPAQEFEEFFGFSAPKRYDLHHFVGGLPSGFPNPLQIFAKITEAYEHTQELDKRLRLANILAREVPWDVTSVKEAERIIQDGYARNQHLVAEVARAREHYYRMWRLALRALIPDEGEPASR